MKFLRHRRRFLHLESVLLLSLALPVCSYSADSDSPLIRAVSGKTENVEAVKSLILQGAELDARDAAGSTALLHAALRGYKDSLRVLLDAGANPNIANSSGETPLEVVIFSRRSAGQMQEMATLLLGKGVLLEVWQAAALGRTQELSRMLSTNPSLVSHAGPMAFTPLQWAAYERQFTAVDFLLAHGANMNICTAAMLGRKDQINDLLDLAPTLLNMHVAGTRTPLHCAVSSGQVDAASLLLARGALMSDEHYLHEAVQRDDKPMVHVLLSFGADKSDFVPGFGTPYVHSLTIHDPELTAILK